MWSYGRGPSQSRAQRIVLIALCYLIRLAAPTNEIWPVERPDGMPSITALEVMCGKDHMDVHLSFSAPFEGIVSSKGQHSDPRCIYVPPSTGKTFFTFRISYSRCGTKPDLNGQFYENTVVVQYDKDLLEVWDEAKRLRCEWFNDYEKTASKPPMVIADLDVIQLDFRGDNVDCWMEIQQGKGPWAPAVSGIVPLGSTMTLVVAINDFRGEFDMRVKSCVASDGAGHVIKLSDEYGCVLRPKMISRFLKARAPDDKASVITYAFFHAFKFPDALSVHIKCKVEICRHGCLDHCQHSGAPVGGAPGGLPAGGLKQNDLLERKDTLVNQNSNDILPDSAEAEIDSGMNAQDVYYDDIIHTEKHLNQYRKPAPGPGPGPMVQKKKDGYLQFHHNGREPMDDIESLFLSDHSAMSADMMKKSQSQPMMQGPPPGMPGMPPGIGMGPGKYPPQQQQLNSKPMPGPGTPMDDDKFPHGPRQMDAEKRMGLPAVAGPRSLNLDAEDVQNQSYYSSTGGARVRQRRSVRVVDRAARSADIGVSGIYEVISEADLAFNPDSKQEAVTVFQGKITEEVVYGICMPVPGFSILFILVISATIISALIAGSLLYRYQLQKEMIANRSASHNAPMNSIATWMTLRLFRSRHSTSGVGGAAARPMDLNASNQ
ncbi:AGAP000786-PA-like protein [Anopheles sinensis]|uniref:AGAP000786-PA-like protein n=1 Tax=Anopheles sinensis TaxID=74873 RepID=A0A084VN25_ANOSI|nr:AGAP000786-PA-like protein [Anopheles sinensis]